MIETIEKQRQHFDSRIVSTSTPEPLKQLRIDFLGKKGCVQALMKDLRQASPEEKRQLGKLINDFTKVIVPPYDVISPSEQNAYYKKSPHNYIRINLNRSAGEDRYFDAANTLALWKNEGILVEEEKEALYILSQSFENEGKRIDRVGCICSLEL